MVAAHDADESRAELLGEPDRRLIDIAHEIAALGLVQLEDYFLAAGELGVHKLR